MEHRHSTNPSTGQDRQTRIESALRFCEQSRRLILSHFSPAGIRAESKGDGSPVTIADRGAEELLRRLIAAEFPDDGVLGEEFGETAGRSGFRWVLDPIDGTRAFMHGVPLFGTLIGIELHGEPVGGVCDLPALGERVFALAGGGAWLQREGTPPARTRVSSVVDAGQATCCYTTPTTFKPRNAMSVFDQLARTFGETRGWSDCYGYVLVATGRADAMIDAVMHRWDVAALIPIIREAGGEMTGWDGERTGAMRDAIAGNPAMHAALHRVCQTGQSGRRIDG